MTKKQRTSNKKPGPPVGLFFLIFLVGGAIAALHFTGKLKPILDSIGKKKPIPVQQPVVTKPAPVVTKPAPVVTKPAPVKKPVAKVVEKSVEKKPEPVKKVSKEDAVAEVYRKRFKAPRVGHPVTVTLKGNVKKTGTLLSMDEESLRMKIGKIEMTLSRNQLAPVGLARCYEDEYVKYMVAKYQRREKALAYQKAQSKKLNDAYAKFMASRGKKLNASPKPGAKQSIEDVDFKKWMEENGQTDLLKARQERVAAYEAERKKAGRAH